MNSCRERREAILTSAAASRRRRNVSGGKSVAAAVMTVLAALPRASALKPGPISFTLGPAAQDVIPLNNNNLGGRQVPPPYSAYSAYPPSAYRSTAAANDAQQQQQRLNLLNEHLHVLHGAQPNNINNNLMNENLHLLKNSAEVSQSLHSSSTSKNSPTEEQKAKIAQAEDELVKELGVWLREHFNKNDDFEVTVNTHIENDFGADSLDKMDLMMQVNKKHNVELSEEAGGKIQTVGDLLKAIEEEKAKVAALQKSIETESQALAAMKAKLAKQGS